MTSNYQRLDDADRVYGSRSQGYDVRSISYKATTGTSLVRRDLDTLARMLKPISIPPYASVAEQVFGTEVANRRLRVQHGLHLLAERRHLHDRQIKEIDNDRFELSKELSGARLHAQEDNHRRALRIEQMMLQLDEARRREERDFWKDTMELRNSLFESAEAYRDARTRASWLEGLEQGGHYDG